jgi:Fe2+ or Zn2+ uptake regulation protein
MYEYGWFFVQEIAKMKGQMTMMNPVSVMTSGPTEFQSAHLVCTDIIQASYALDEKILLKEVNSKSDFAIDHHHLEFFGRCKNCQ